MSKDLLLQIEQLKGELQKLSKENALLKKSLVSESEHTVKTPSNIQPIFDKAEKIVGDYFQQLQLKPSKGTIEINDERYVLVRASALSNEFFKTITNRKGLKGKCGHCEYTYTCGGCRVMAYFHTNDLYGEDPLCFINDLTPEELKKYEDETVKSFRNYLRMAYFGRIYKPPSE